MAVEKINDFLNCYFDTMELSDEQIKTYIRNGIINRYNTYKDVFPTIPIDDDTYQNYAIKSSDGYYNLENFLLNRLFQSLRNVFIKDNENADSSAYSSKNRTIYFSETAIKTNIFNKLQNWPNELKEKYANIILKTVFDHELGHALKTKFSNGYKTRSDNNQIILEELFKALEKNVGKEKATEIISSSNISTLKSSDDLYKDLLNNLSTIQNGKYSSSILTPTELIEEYSTEIGSGIKKRTDIIEQTLLDEILQETESMNNVGLYEVPLLKKPIGNIGNYINSFHPFSGYSPILGYGKILTTLFGIKDTFQATYLNPHPVFDEFNILYDDLSKDIFNNPLSPIANINETLTKIMTEKNEQDYLKLDLFFASCYERKIEKQLLENKKLNKEKTLQEIESIQNHLTRNDDEDTNNSLPHNQILNTIKTQVPTFNNTETIRK